MTEPRPTEPRPPHWEGCELLHHDCALARLEEARRERDGSMRETGVLREAIVEALGIKAERVIPDDAILIESLFARLAALPSREHLTELLRDWIGYRSTFGSTSGEALDAQSAILDAVCGPPEGKPAPFDPVHSPGMTDLMVPPETIDDGAPGTEAP